MDNDSHVEPDRRLRRAVAVVAIVLVVAGLVGMGLLVRATAGIEKLSGDGLVELLLRLKTIALTAAGIAWCGIIGCSLWLFGLGSRVVRADRYPPPGARALRRTRIRTGLAARRVANLAFLCSVLLAVAGSLGVWHLMMLALGILRELGAP